MLAGACTGGSTESTTTTSTTTTSTTTPSAPTTSIVQTLRPAVAMPVFVDDDELIPTDDEVVVGTLDNGLTYYIRENDAPGGRAQLRLVVNAGSLLEESDQRGGAHYLEHMMFNGTEAYPQNELVRVLQRFGSEFGPDINAYTSYDETVYELQVPTDSRATLDTAIDVLYEWASKATIDADDVESERGVLVEEWRLRSQGFWGRYFDSVDDILLANSIYAGQDPLGTLEDLESVTPESLRRFYDDWYRPNLMAVVAVGDFDVDRMEASIRDRFGALENPVNGPDRPSPTTAPFGEPATLVLVDEELPDAFVELNYPMPVDAAPTVGLLRRELAFSVALDVIVTRLQEDALGGDVPFFDPSFAANPLVRAQQSPGLATSADPGNLSAATEALLTEVERMIRYGMSPGELDRAVGELRQSVDVGLASADSTQDWEFASQYVGNFLSGTPIPDAETAHDLSISILDAMTVEQVTDTFGALITSTEPLIIVAGPSASADLIPSDDDLIETYARVLRANIEPRGDSAQVADGLMAAPDPVD
ncbi:MAG: insulinase family protein, partial [Acidimicrobiia bacterium]|nr:insulinase family protein [Acidimicrobiia bacterium]